MNRSENIKGITRGNLVFALAISLVVVALLAGFFFLFVQYASWQGSINYSKRPAAATFLIATGSALPRGVSNLRIAGHSYPGTWKNWIWTSFDANDAVVQKIVGDEKPVGANEAHKIIKASRKISTNNRYNDVDLARVRWDEVDAIASPQVYEIVGGTGGANFFSGYLIYDGVHKRAYTYVSGGD